VYTCRTQTQPALSRPSALIEFYVHEDWEKLATLNYQPAGKQHTINMTGLILVEIGMGCLLTMMRMYRD